jgi:hypothetical protein
VRTKGGSDRDLGKSAISLLAARKHFSILADDLNKISQRCPLTGSLHAACKTDIAKYIKPGVEKNRQEARRICLLCESEKKSLFHAACKHFEDHKSTH